MKNSEKIMEKDLIDSLKAAIFWSCKMKFLIREECKKKGKLKYEYQTKEANDFIYGNNNQICQ